MANAAPPLGTRDRHAAIHDAMRTRISLLDYPPGTRLSEAELALEFGISRTPMRRVLARLEDEGLVRSAHGVGTFVTDADVGALAQAYRLRMELTALTGVLDPVAPDAAFIAAFDALIDRSRRLMRDYEPRAFTRLDMDVFQHLLGLTGNGPLRAANERLFFQTKRIWLKLALAAQIDIKEEFAIFHRELEDLRRAIVAGDLEAVAHLRRAHISMSFGRLQEAAARQDAATPNG